MKDYSQSGEQPIIHAYFGGRVGRFLEIGAFDGISYSNTYALLQRGWHGVAYEPSRIFSALTKNLADFDVDCVKAGLALNDGKATFFDGGGSALSTTSPDHVALWKGAGAEFETCEIDVCSWQTIAYRHGKNFDLLSLDVEGTSFPLFAAMPKYIAPEMVIVEHDNVPSDAFTIIRPEYRVLARTDLNMVMALK